MKINRSDLLTIAATQKQYPPEGPPEIAFCGRSNVGKSSLLNLLTNRKSLARVSGSPGKTRTINFYTINDDTFRIVDLPGYGYAKVSKSLSAGWGDMIETYLRNRQSLLKVAILTDIRHAPSEQDIQMYEWLKHYGKSGIIIATKADKIKKSELAPNIARIKKVLNAEEEAKIYPVSALKRTGVDAVLEAISLVIASPPPVIASEAKQSTAAISGEKGAQ
jgi:GTP-binding protein